MSLTVKMEHGVVPMSDRRFVFFAAIVGNILEYYDFTVYAVFSVMIGKVFFPNVSEFLQLLSSLAVFAVGFVTRPIGGIVFGYIGDRFGRRISLIASMLGMTIPTFAMGFLPGYNDIGVAAPILLVVFRLIQGLCISGEGAGAAIFVLEHGNNMKPGFVTALVHGSNMAGTLIASGVGILIERTFFGVEDAWRWAFVVGGLMGLVGFYLRLRVSETPIFTEVVERKKTLSMPFLHVMKTAWPSILLTTCVAGVASSIVYSVKTVNVFFTSVMHMSQMQSLVLLSYAFAILLITIPFFGYLSDRIGYVLILRLAAMCSIVLSVPIFMLLTSKLLALNLLGLTLLSTLAGAISGPAYIFVISLFKPEERFSGVAFSYNLGVALCGGTAGIVSRTLVEWTGLSYAPSFYIMFTSTIFLIVLISNRNISRYKCM